MISLKKILCLQGLVLLNVSLKCQTPGTYHEHPDTHVILDKHSIPYLDEAFALVNHACELLGDRLIGWDVCIGPEGPIIIEGNHNYHMVMQEVAYGGYRKHPDFIRVLAEENIRP